MRATLLPFILAFLPTLLGWQTADAAPSSAESIDQSVQKPVKKKKQRVIGSAWLEATQHVYLPSMDDKTQDKSPKTTPPPAPTPAPQPAQPRPDLFYTPREQAPAMDPLMAQQFFRDLSAVLNEEDDDDDFDDEEPALSPEEEAEFTRFFMSALQAPAR